MKIFKILSINIIFICILSTFAEIIYRVHSGLKNETLSEMLLPISKDESYGMYSFDSFLGYSPTPNFRSVINNPLKKWNKVQVTILDNSTRLSSKESLILNHPNAKRKKIITVGDSFTFGDQVSDSDTWQSCLNSKESNYFYINGGVGGYGILQPILRAEKLSSISSDNISGIILSVLVGQDAVRDKLEFRSGFPKPSLLKMKTGEIVIKQIPVDSKSAIGGKYTKAQANIFVAFFSNITFLKEIPYVSKVYFKLHSLYVNRLTRQNESPPTVNEIYNWAAKNSKNIHPNIIWVLQYYSSISDKVPIERKYIRDLLTKEKIKFIDTYDNLHGDQVSYSPSDLWYDHHTPLGNKVVCNTIHEYINSSD